MMRNSSRPLQHLAVPAELVGTHTLRAPYKLAVVGEAKEAARIMEVEKYLSELVLWHSDSYVHSAGTEMLVLTLPYAVNPESIMRQHPAKLAMGYGIHEGQSTEALFVGPNHRKIQPESAVWLGRALASQHIERVHYLGSGISHIDGVAQDEKLHMIDDPREVFSFVSQVNGSEIPYLTGVQLGGGEGIQ